MRIEIEVDKLDDLVRDLDSCLTDEALLAKCKEYEIVWTLSACSDRIEELTKAILKLKDIPEELQRITTEVEEAIDTGENLA